VGAQDKLNRQRASRKADRENIAAVLVEIAATYGAAVERRDDGPNPGYRGASIALSFSLNGVGANVDIDNLHGGKTVLIHWYNTEFPARNFTQRFERCVLSRLSYRPHHKATSHPADWYSLSMALDAGLMLAMRGEAFMSESA